MKRNLSLWQGLPAAAGLLAFALLPALAQSPTTPAAPTAPAGPTGKIHGHVTNPTGASQGTGTVSLSSDGGRTQKFTFQVAPSGDYEGEAAPGTYTMSYRAPDTPPDKVVDSFEGIKIVVGQDVVQDIDMSRKAFVDRLPPEQQKQLEELKKHNAEAMQANEIIKTLNADLRVVAQDIKDADTVAAQAAAVQALGPTAAKADIDAKAAEIKAAKYTDIQTLMLRDSAAKPDASILWAQLGIAQVGLKKYDDAEPNLKKALDLEAASKKPSPSIQALAHSGLGEIYARTGKIPEANAAYDAAAKANPTEAGFYLRNEAVIFSQTGKADAQVAAADEAIQADPTQPLPYYLKGQGLIQSATFDAKTQKIVLPPGCAEAYQKYLELAPNGPYATDVKGILDQAGQKVTSTFKAGKKTN